MTARNREETRVQEEDRLVQGQTTPSEYRPKPPVLQWAAQEAYRSPGAPETWEMETGLGICCRPCIRGGDGMGWGGGGGVGDWNLTVPECSQSPLPVSRQTLGGGKKVTVATRIPLRVSHQGEEPLGGWGLEKVSKTDSSEPPPPPSLPPPPSAACRCGS